MTPQTIQARRDTLHSWQAADPILAEGEFGHVTGELDLRIGDGMRPFSQLTNVLEADPVLASANW